jgi:hypothetical protein
MGDRYLRTRSSSRARAHTPAYVRLRTRVCVSVYGGGVWVRVFICVRTHWVRVRARVPLCAHVRGFGFRGFPPDRNLAAAFARVCVLRVCVCVCSEHLCAPRQCARPLVARRRLAIFIARPAPRFAAACACLWLVPPAGLERVGRRSDVHQSYGQRAVGCAIWAHVRGRRRRRHLRHRRQQRHLTLPPLLLLGRVGEHRRRCAAGLGRGGSAGTRGGYKGAEPRQSAHAVPARYSGVPRGY